MDIRMPAMDGVEATRVLAADAASAPGSAEAAVGPTSPRILVVTTFDDDEYVFEALRAGAAGFILKDTPPETLLAAIKTVASGDALLSPGVTRRLIAEFVRRPRPAADDGPKRAEFVAALTERERDVLCQVASGYSNAEIAAALYVGVSTVKTHVGHLLMKLGARDRAQLVIAAYESGLVVPESRSG